MKHYITLILFSICIISVLDAQNVGIGTTTPDPSAMLDITSTDKGILIPRVDRTAISSPAHGLLIFDNSTSSFWYYNDAWINLDKGIPAFISDADFDTKVFVEQTPDDDIIRFYSEGTEYLRINPSGRIDVLNTGNSVYIGENAGMVDDASDNQNIGIGTNSMSLNTTGQHNTALGHKTLDKNQIGNSNTALGHQSLGKNVNSNNNTAVGANALRNNVGGGQNTAVGYTALNNNNSSYNTAVGNAAMFSTNSGASNTAMGASALYKNTTGTDNVAIGREALNNNLTASNNIAVGRKALYTNSTGAQNVAIGTDALKNNNTAHDNTAVGFYALKSNTTGYDNISIGKGASAGNTIGSSNVAIGNDALTFNNAGSESTAIGSGALLFANPSPTAFVTGNVAVGYHSIHGSFTPSNNTGQNNTAVGHKSLTFNTEGSDNTANGYHALYLNTTGSSNTALGKQAGHNNNTGSGNVFLGKEAGYNELSSNKLYIDNSQTSDPLIWGDFDADEVVVNGSLGVMNMDTNNTGELLVIHNPDGTLSARTVASLPSPPIDTTRNLATDFELAKIMCECPDLPPYLIRKLLDAGYTVKDLVFAGVDQESIFTALKSGSFIDSRDNKSYNTIMIGSQEWMAENLNIGDMIDSGTNQSQQTPEVIEKYCYDDESANCALYGGIYQWNETMQYITTESTQGICPVGWHLPSDEEWKILEISLGMSSSEADMIGYRGTTEGSKLAGIEPLWADDNLDQHADFSTSGFYALPAGNWWDALNDFFGNLNNVSFWTSTEYSTGHVWARSIESDRIKVGRQNGLEKISGVSVRCIKD